MIGLLEVIPGRLSEQIIYTGANKMDTNSEGPGVTISGASDFLGLLHQRRDFCIKQGLRIGQPRGC